ncbi:hypothetical protein D3C80_1883210 [compost metagenome]
MVVGEHQMLAMLAGAHQDQAQQPRAPQFEATGAVLFGQGLQGRGQVITAPPVMTGEV